MFSPFHFCLLCLKIFVKTKTKKGFLCIRISPFESRNVLFLGSNATKENQKQNKTKYKDKQQMTKTRCKKSGNKPYNNSLFREIPPNISKYSKYYRLIIKKQHTIDLTNALSSRKNLVGISVKYSSTIY